MKIKKLKVHLSLFTNFVFILFILLFLLQAYMHDKNIVYIFVFFVLGLIGSNYFLLRKNLLGLDFKFINIHSTFAKESTVINIMVKNPDKYERFDINIYNSKFKIDAFIKKEVSVLYRFPNRGKHKIPTFEVHSKFPLYLFDNYYSLLTFDEEIIVFPQKKGKSLEVFLTKQKNIYGELDDFKGIREYIEGDLISLIHWKSLAKGKLMSKEFEYIGNREELIFDYDLVKGDIEVKLSQLTRWVVEAKKKELDFKVRIKKREFHSKKHSIREILTFMALYQDN